MGCDIHIYVEQNKNGKWESIDNWQDEYDEGYLSVPYEESIYSGRNYQQTK